MEPGAAREAMVAVYSAAVAWVPRTSRWVPGKPWQVRRLRWVARAEAAVGAWMKERILLHPGQRPRPWSMAAAGQ